MVGALLFNYNKSMLHVKKAITLLLVLLLAVCSFAQRGALVRLTLRELQEMPPDILYRFTQENPRFLLVNGTEETLFSSDFLNYCWPDVQGYVSSALLEKEIFPLSAEKNAHLLTQSLKKISLDLQRFQAQQRLITESLKDKLYTGKIPYENYLPKNVDYIYVGEVHEHPRIQQEIVEFITSLPKIYPNRKIFVAAEYVPDAHYTAPINGDLPDLLFVENKEHLADLLGTAYPQAAHLEKVLDSGISLVGLDPANLIVHQIAQEMVEAGIQKNADLFLAAYDKINGSDFGMSMRNNVWRQHIAQLRERFPDALIVVYGGAGHIAYQINNSVPNLVKHNSFVTLFLVPQMLSQANPIFRFLSVERNIRTAFHRNIDAKIVTSWKNSSNFKKLMGADLTVITH